MLIVLTILLLLVIVSSFVRRQAAAIRAEDEAAAKARRAEILLAAGGGAAAVMDVAMAETVASLAADAAGDAGLYFSSGGGIPRTNGGDAAIAFVAEAQRRASAFANAGDPAFPSRGRVRFYVRTGDGLRVAEASEADLQQGRDPLTPLYAAAQNVIAELRKKK